MGIEIFKDKKMLFRFRVKARNGKIIAQSEAYTSKSGCEKGVDSLINNLAPMIEYDYRQEHTKDLTNLMPMVNLNFIWGLE